MDVLSDVLAAVRLKGAIFFDIDMRHPWVGESPPGARSATSRSCRSASTSSCSTWCMSGSCWAALGESEARRRSRLSRRRRHRLPERRRKTSMSSHPGERQHAQHVDLPPAPERPAALHDHPPWQRGYRAHAFHLRLPRLRRAPLQSAALGAARNHLRSQARGRRRLGGRSLQRRPRRSATAAAPAPRPILVKAQRADVRRGRPPPHRVPPRGLARLALRPPRPSRRRSPEADPRPPHRTTGPSTASPASVGLSRTTFADRFVHYVGIPPMQYLARWRMQLAARLSSKIRGSASHRSPPMSATNPKPPSTAPSRNSSAPRRAPGAAAATSLSRRTTRRKSEGQRPSSAPSPLSASSRKARSISSGGSFAPRSTHQVRTDM